MHSRLALKLAGRIDALLLQDLAQGVDVARMVADPLYARDVLLVCDTYRGGELGSLAQQFRALVAAGGTAPPADAAAARPRPGPTSAQPARHTERHAPRQQGGSASASRPDSPGEVRSRPAVPAAAADVARRARQAPPTDRPTDPPADHATRDSTGFSASRFFSSLFGPMVSLDEPPSRRVQPPRSWFGRNRSASK